MRTLYRDGKTITVPADVAGDYIGQGWQTAPEAPKPLRARRKPARASKPRTPKPPAAPEA
jgi:hypothetical protein